LFFFALQTDVRKRYRNYFNSPIFRFHPCNVKQGALHYISSCGRDGMIVVPVCMLADTGLMSKFVCRPVSESAYKCIVHI